GRLIAARVAGGPSPPPFRYRDLGDLATIGRGAAVVKLGRLEGDLPRRRACAYEGAKALFRRRLHAETARLRHRRARRRRSALLLCPGDHRRTRLSDFAARCQAHAGGSPPVRAYVVHSRLHRPGGPQMIWKTGRDSTRIPTNDGTLAVRVDGDPHKAPLLLCQRFRGTMDDWDPEFVARLSTARRVIRFDNLGLGESSGETSNTVRGMAEVVPLLLDALGIGAIDLLGWSLGGYVGQTVALTWPDRIHHLVIAGSGPGGPDGPPPHPRVAEIAAKTAAAREDVQFLFFTATEAGTAAARRHFDRIRLGERPPVAAESGRRQRE